MQKYTAGTAAGFQDEDMISSFLEALGEFEASVNERDSESDFHFSTAEKIHLINHRPEQLVEIHLVSLCLLCGCL